MTLFFDYPNSSIKGLRIENLSSTPAPGNPGRMVFNTTSLRLLVDTGSVFETVGQIDNTGTLSADNLTASSVNTNLTLSPSGTATSVVVATGKTLTVDRISTTTATTDLTLSATGSNIVIDTGKFLKVTGASSGAVPYFNASQQMVTSVTGSTSQVLIGGTTPSFGSVTSSMVNSSIIVASGANAFTGNQDFGNHQALDFKVENLSSDPVAGNAGRLIWNTTSSTMKIDNGSTFIPFVPNYKLFGSTTSDSTTISNTSAQTLFSQQITVPANSISVGSVIKLFASGSYALNSGTFALVISLSGANTNLPALNLTPATSGLWCIEAEITCQNSGGFAVVSTRTFYGGGDPASVQVSYIASASVTIPSSSTFGFGVKFSAASVSNTAVQNQLTVGIVTVA